ncbi:MAG: hypothetical protein ACUVRS_05490 [Armatimonadota bacterium]
MRVGTDIACFRLIAGWYIFALMLACTCSLAGAAQNFERAGVYIEAGAIKLSRTVNRIEASGDVRLSAVDPTAGVRLSAEAKMVTVTLFTMSNQKASVRGLESIKAAEFEGPVKLIYRSPKTVVNESGNKVSEVNVTTTATATRASFDGVRGVVVLTGNVKITQEDPSIFAEPAVMTGDKAFINVRPSQGESDYDFKIESVERPSRIEIVPKRTGKQ